jgi:hypothetical protein
MGLELTEAARLECSRSTVYLERDRLFERFGVHDLPTLVSSLCALT